jgi:hypothetical protein
MLEQISRRLKIPLGAVLLVIAGYDMEVPYQHMLSLFKANASRCFVLLDPTYLSFQARKCIVLLWGGVVHIYLSIYACG